MLFSVVMCGSESWTIKKAECWRIDSFELWCWRKLLRVPWTARRSNQSILKQISPEYSLEAWCWSWNSNTLATCCEEPTHLKRPRCWERLKAGGEGDDSGWNDWMALPAQWTWVWVNSRSWWWTGGLTCCSPWGPKESNATKQLKWTELRIVVEVRMAGGHIMYITVGYFRILALTGSERETLAGSLNLQWDKSNSYLS